MQKSILIITQKVDTRDPVLGFFCRWILEFSKRFDHVHVICLQKGDYDLPSNVTVFSLGKERKISKLQYVVNFYRLIWQLRAEYTSVFVHMNQEYVLLGGLFWRLFGKRILMWRNHPQGNFLTKISVFLSHRVYCTSRDSFTNKFKKTRLMPVGIVVKNTPTNISRKRRSILSLGRISPVKNIETIVSAFKDVAALNEQATLSIVGDPMPRKIDLDYHARIVASVRGLSSVAFYPGVAPEETERFFLSHDLFVNATTPGSFDKTILESMSLGTPSFVCQNIWEGTELSYLSEHLYFPFKDHKALSSKIRSFFILEEGEKEKLRADCIRFVKEHHSLDSLVDRIVSDI